MIEMLGSQHIQLGLMSLKKPLFKKKIQVLTT